MRVLSSEFLKEWEGILEEKVKVTEENMSKGFKGVEHMLGLKVF